MKLVQGWHFLSKRGQLAHNGGVAADPSGVEQFSGKVEACKSGLHASVSARDALRHAPGLIVRRVELVDPIEQSDKMVSAERRVLWTADATKTVKLWAIWCAEQALALVGDDTEEKQVAILASCLALEVARECVEDPSARAADAAYAAAADAARSEMVTRCDAELERMLLELGQ